jgi:hypothetical protein
MGANSNMSYCICMTQKVSTRPDLLPIGTTGIKANNSMQPDLQINRKKVVSLFVSSNFIILLWNKARYSDLLA